MRLVAVDTLAAQRGLFAGQSYSDAKALVPDVFAKAIDTAMLGARFADFCDWHSNASPLVACLGGEEGYGDLMADITGVAHLFGGEQAMLDRLTGRLRAMGFAVAGAIAGTVGSAWALSHFRPGTVLDTDPAKALADLPVAALRLEEKQVWALMQMGLKRIGQLEGRDRKSLAARFGQRLILRLDQAMGRAEETIVPRLPAVEHYAERRFAEPIGLIDDVLMCARDLAIQVGLRLTALEMGAQTFHLFLYRVDHKVMVLSVNAGRATRDAGHIARLFENRAERLAGEYDAGFGVDMIRLAASSVSPVSLSQIGAFEAADSATELSELYDRIASRLGPLAVTRSRFVNSHIPEKAVVLEPVLARQPDDPAAMPDPTRPRPLRLLPRPEPIEVMAEVPDAPPLRMRWRGVGYRFSKASGPERIGREWWGPDFALVAEVAPQAADNAVSNRDEEQKPDEAGSVRNPIAARDYYVAEDEAGRRFWLFRAGLYEGSDLPRWYLHGLFA